MGRCTQPPRLKFHDGNDGRWRQHGRQLHGRERRRHDGRCYGRRRWRLRNLHALQKNERVHPEVHVGAPRLLRLPRHVREIECSRCCCRRRGRLWPWAEVYARISGSRRSRSNGQTWVWAAFHLGRVEHSSSFRPLAKNGSARGGPGCMPTREAKSTCSFFRLGGLSRSAAGKGHMNSP